MYSIMYVTHAFLHSKSAHCPFWQGAQGAPSICALLQDYNKLLTFAFLSYLSCGCTFWCANPIQFFSSQFLP